MNQKAIVFDVGTIDPDLGGPLGCLMHHRGSGKGATCDERCDDRYGRLLGSPFVYQRLVVNLFRRF